MQSHKQGTKVFCFPGSCLDPQVCTHQRALRTSVCTKPLAAQLGFLGSLFYRVPGLCPFKNKSFGHYKILHLLQGSIQRESAQFASGKSTFMGLRGRLRAEEAEWQEVGTPAAGQCLWGTPRFVLLFTTARWSEFLSSVGVAFHINIR